MNANRPPAPADLPPYLAYARLDPASVSLKGGRLSARYAAGGETVFRVDWKPGSCSLFEDYRGKDMTYSLNYPDLRSAFFGYLQAMKPLDNPRFRSLVDGLSGNVYFQFPGQQPEGLNAFFYPAGYIFLLRLPLTPRNLPGWLKIRPDCAGEPPGPLPIRLQQEWDGLVLKYRLGGAVEVETVGLADLAATLIDLPGAVRILRKAGLILPEKEHWLAIRDAADPGNYPGNMIFNRGDPARGDVAFSITIAPPEGPDSLIPFFREGVERIFGASRFAS